MANEYDFLMHYGIKGQRWGIRRFQNEDGTLTAEGKARYSSIESGIVEKLNANKKISDKELSDFKKYRDKCHTEITKKWKNNTNNLSEEEYHKANLELGEMLLEQEKMDYAFARVNHEQIYQNSIQNETNPRYIDPAFRKFNSKADKAQAEKEYLSFWSEEEPEYGDPDRAKWEREIEHLTNRVFETSIGHGLPHSDRQKELFDLDLTGKGYNDTFLSYDNWDPKYTKTDEWKRLQNEKELVYKELKVDDARDKWHNSTLDDSHKALVSYMELSRKFNQTDVMKQIDRIESDFRNSINVNALLDMGYEVNPTNIKLMDRIINDY